MRMRTSWNLGRFTTILPVSTSSSSITSVCAIRLMSAVRPLKAAAPESILEYTRCRSSAAGKPAIAVARTRVGRRKRIKCRFLLAFTAWQTPCSPATHLPNSGSALRGTPPGSCCGAAPVATASAWRHAGSPVCPPALSPAQRTADAHAPGQHGDFAGVGGARLIAKPVARNQKNEGQYDPYHHVVLPTGARVVPQDETLEHLLNA